MSWLRSSLLSALFLIPCPQARAGFGASLPGQIEKFKMSGCQADHAICFHVESPTAEGSQLKRLFVLDDVQLQLDDRKTGRKTMETWPKAYVDLELNRLVLWKTIGGARTEKIFDF